MTKSLVWFVSILIIAILSFLLFNNSITSENYSKQYQTEQLEKTAIYSPVIPEDIEFSNERVPIKNFDVYERLDNEMLANAFWHSQMIRFLKRSYRYFPIIEPILKKNNIPDDFKYLAVAESGLSNVVSPSNAAGFWQFLKKTGIEYGLVINSEVDERYHLEKATQAACDYLKKSYEQFGSWTLVAASYNMGMSGISKRLESQKVESYYDLYLNEETSRYVFRLLAIKTIMQKPSNYGFKLRTEDMYQPIPTFEAFCDSSIDDLSQWALEQGINYKVLKILNPWLRNSQLKNTEKRTYQIKIPEKGFRKFANSKFEIQTQEP